VVELLLPALFLTAIGGGMALRFAFHRDRRIKRMLRRIVPTPIAEAPDGRAIKIVGELLCAGRSLTAPLSGRACAYYTVVVEEYRGGGKGGRWKEILREEKGVDFFLRDDSGTALVHFPADGHVWPALVEDRRARVSPIFHADEALKRFLAERGRPVDGWFVRRNQRAREGVLEAGERVAVAGTARWLPAPDGIGGGYREAGKRLVLQGSEQLGLFLSDDPAAL
jgi:hypothetical protein